MRTASALAAAATAVLAAAGGAPVRPAELEPIHPGGEPYVRHLVLHAGRTTAAAAALEATWLPRVLVEAGFWSPAAAAKLRPANAALTTGGERGL